MASYQEGVAKLDEFVDILQEERDRLVNEVLGLETARTGICVGGVLPIPVPGLAQFMAIACSLNLGELTTRADSLGAMIDGIENHAAQIQRFSSLPETAANVAKLQRMLDSTAKIISTVRTTSAVDDLFVDVVEFVNGMIVDAGKLIPKLPSLGIGLGGLLLGGAVAVAVLR